MLVDVNDLVGGSQNIDMEIAPDAIDLDDERARLVGPVKLNCEIARDGVQTKIAGSIESKLEVDCSRCLEPVEQTLNFDFAVQYLNAEHFAAAGEREIKPDDLAADSLDDEQI